MADKRLADMDPSAALVATDKLYAYTGDGDVYATAAQIKTFVDGGYYVNVKDFGAVGDGSHNDTPNIQAAIDYAYDNGYGTVYMPSGTYNTDEPLWLDAPGNARDNFLNPPNANFTLRLVGDGFGGSDAPGTRIYCNHFETGLYVGPGQHMGVTGIQMFGSPGSFGQFVDLTARDTSGIQILCGNGGAHVTNITDCSVAWFTYGIRVGGNKDALGDSTTVIHSNVAACTWGFYVSNTQQFINALRDCTFDNCKVFVHSNSNAPIQVTGGNYSSYYGGYATYDMDTVSAIDTVTVCSNNSSENDLVSGDPYSFTVHLPGTGIGEISPSWTAEQDRFAIKTDNYGIIPFFKESWDPGTGTLRLQFVGDWFATLFDVGGTNVTDTYDVMEDIQAQDKLYAASISQFADSAGVNMQGVHIENPNVLSRIMRVTGGWNSSKTGKIEDVQLNWLPSFADYAGDPDGQYHSLAVLATVWPIISVNAGCNIFIDNLHGYDSKPILAYLSPRDCEIRNVEGVPLNVKGLGAQNSPLTGASEQIETPCRGFGSWDISPFTVPGEIAPSIRIWYHTESGRTPFVGYYPAPWTLPRLTTAQLDLVSAPITLGSSATFLDQTTGPICGDCLYRIGDALSTPGAPNLVRFNHRGWSWGADITGNWEHAIAYNVVYMDDDLMKWMFPGLVIGLPYDVDGWFTGTRYFAVMAVWEVWGYVEVCRYEDTQFRQTMDAPGGPPFANLTYTGTSVIQEPFVITRIGDIQATALTDTHIAGKNFYVGDKIWQSVPSAGTSMGWVCTTAGVAGSGAVFKAMANLS
jgi:hypothetical protein